MTPSSASSATLETLARAVVRITILRRRSDYKRERVSYLQEFGWTPIPFTPIGAPAEFIAPVTHIHQKWNKEGHTKVITERALKIEAYAATERLMEFLGIAAGDFEIK